QWLANNTSNWGTGNNNQYNTFCKAYPKSVANGNSTVPIMTVGVSAGTDTLSLMKFAGITQLQSFSGDTTGTALLLSGLPGAFMNIPIFDSLDIEGQLLNGV